MLWRSAASVYSPVMRLRAVSRIRKVFPSGILMVILLMVLMAAEPPLTENIYANVVIMMRECWDGFLTLCTPACVFTHTGEQILGAVHSTLSEEVGPCLYGKVKSFLQSVDSHGA